MSIEFTFYDNSDDPPNANEPETFGPYTDAQMTYNLLRVDDDRNLAVYDGTWWWVGGDSNGTRRFTDFVISMVQDEYEAQRNAGLTEAT